MIEIILLHLLVSGINGMLPNIGCYDGEDYVGTVQHQKRGKECLEWTLFTSYLYANVSVDLIEEAQNYCRMFDGDVNFVDGKKPWCFWQKPYKWNYCSVPECSSEIKHPYIMCTWGNGAISGIEQVVKLDNCAPINAKSFLQTAMGKRMIAMEETDSIHSAMSCNAGGTLTLYTGDPSAMKRTCHVEPGGANSTECKYFCKNLRKLFNLIHSIVI